MSKGFEIIGVDISGPVYLKSKPTQKSYIALFTCALVRAIHLELVLRSKADGFLEAFRRFAARRVFPVVIYSDDALCFKRACM